MVMIVERWRPIAGFEGLYEVSDMGRVRSLPGGHRHGCVLRPKIPADPRQYSAVSLHKGGERTRRHVHVLVAGAFLPLKPSPEHEIRHYDGNHGNNTADNLLWGTKAENAADRNRHGRTASGQRHGRFRHGLWKSLRGVSRKKRDAALKARTRTA